MDWWEQPTTDLLPLLRRSPALTVDVIDTLGYAALLRFNHLLPPFDNPAIRRALLGAFSQTDMMDAVSGDSPGMSKTGVGFFTPGSACASDEGMAALTGPRDLTRVKAALAAAGYDGQRFVFLVPTDLPAINAMSEVAADIFRKLGMNMDYQTQDWGTVAQRLNSPSPLDHGGWSVTANYAPGYAAMSPAAHAFLRGTGRQALWGWPTMPKVEALRTAWIDATDPAEQQKLCRAIQAQAFEDVPYIPLGAFFFAAAYRRDLTGMLKGSIPMFTNLRRA
jgi:peptide/nickel transport system substrate-binding protein